MEIFQHFFHVKFEFISRKFSTISYINTSKIPRIFFITFINKFLSKLPRKSMEFYGIFFAFYHVKFNFISWKFSTLSSMYTSGIPEIFSIKNFSLSCHYIIIKSIVEIQVEMAEMLSCMSLEITRLSNIKGYSDIGVIVQTNQFRAI